MKRDLSLELIKHVLPLELVDYFALVSIEETAETLHLYLEEHNIIPSEYESLSLSANGFYPDSTIKDFYKLYEWLLSENAKSTVTECGFMPK